MLVDPSAKGNYWNDMPYGMCPPGGNKLGYLDFSFQLVLPLFASVQVSSEPLQSICFVLADVLLNRLIAIGQLIGEVVNVS